MKSIGMSIRNERRKRNFTIAQLAESTNLSKGFISQIERGIAQPSVTTLKKITQSLGISVVSLFGENQNGNGINNPVYDSDYKNKNEDYVREIKIVKSKQRKKMSLPGSHIVYEMVTPDLRRKMQILFLQCDPGEKSGDEPIIDPTGEKCLVILNGAIEYRLANEVFILEKGDSIYFPASLPQSWRGIGSERIEVLIVMTPPWF